MVVQKAALEYSESRDRGVVSSTNSTTDGCEMCQSVPTEVRLEQEVVVPAVEEGAGLSLLLLSLTGLLSQVKMCQWQFADLDIRQC